MEEGAGQFPGIYNIICPNPNRIGTATKLSGVNGASSSHGFFIAELGTGAGIWPIHLRPRA